MDAKERLEREIRHAAIRAKFEAPLNRKGERFGRFLVVVVIAICAAGCDTPPPLDDVPACPLDGTDFHACQDVAPTTATCSKWPVGALQATPVVGCRVRADFGGMLCVEACAVP